MAKRAAGKTGGKSAAKGKPAKAAGGLLGGDDPDDAPSAATALAAADKPASTPAPVPLASIVGQEHAVSVLTGAINAGRVHHAWIFHGPQGVGKLTTAVAFAALLLDPTTAVGLTGELAPDPDSRVQHLLAAGTHPDLHVITKELALYSEDRETRNKKLRTIPKQVIRDHLLDPAHLAASIRNDAVASKVFIVDEAELLDASPYNAPVQNSILKTMEEPPERTVIILVTTSEEQLLPTIRSRCQRVAFTPLTPEAMGAWLSRHTFDLLRDQRDWLLDFAEGSPGAFLHALQWGLAQWRDTLAPGLDRAVRGEFALGLGQTMADLVEGYAKAWVDAHDNASKEAANRAGADWMFRLISHRLRAEMRSAASRNPDRAARAADAIDRLRQAEREFDANVNSVFVMDKLAAEIAEAFAQ